MDTNGAAAQLDAVEHQVIGLGPNPGRISGQVGQILRVGHGEGVMHGDIALLLLGIFKLRKVRNEKETVVILGPQPQPVAQIQPQAAQGAAHAG